MARGQNFPGARLRESDVGLHRHDAGRGRNRRAATGRGTRVLKRVKRWLLAMLASRADQPASSKHPASQPAARHGDRQRNKRGVFISEMQNHCYAPNHADRNGNRAEMSSRVQAKVRAGRPQLQKSLEGGLFWFGPVVTLWNPTKRPKKSLEKLGEKRLRFGNAWRKAWRRALFHINTPIKVDRASSRTRVGLRSSSRTAAAARPSPSAPAGVNTLSPPRTPGPRRCSETAPPPSISTSAKAPT